MAETNKRVRRTAVEARTLILNAAEARLQSDGPEGLKVQEVAAVAGVAHSTVLHHFGSAAGLRAALVEDMGKRLLEDILALFKSRDAGQADSQVLFNVFATLSDKGHARLMAWMMLKGDQPTGSNERTQALFHQLIEEVAATMVYQDDQSEKAWRQARRTARFATMLAAVAAVGDGISGGFLAEQIGLSEKEAKTEFRSWFAQVLNGETNRDICP